MPVTLMCSWASFGPQKPSVQTVSSKQPFVKLSGGPLLDGIQTCAVMHIYTPHIHAEFAEELPLHQPAGLMYKNLSCQFSDEAGLPVHLRRRGPAAPPPLRG